MICESSFRNRSVVYFVAEPSISLGREIDWKIVVFTPENVEKGKNVVALAVLSACSKIQ